MSGAQLRKKTMGITLRVVGIFFETKLELGEKATVKEVINAAENAITAGTTFRCMTKGKGENESPHLFYAFYESDFKSKSDTPYSKGEYSLAENLTPDTASRYSVWQYYITKPDGTSYNPGGGKSINYDDPKAIVEDGGMVTWRLVNILSAPSEASPRSKSMMMS